MMMLGRASTGESWNGLMHDCLQHTGFFASIYWVVYVMITFFIFVNVFIAVIYENFADITSGDSQNDVLSLKRTDLKAFVQAWAKINPSGDPYMKTVNFPRFLRNLPLPMGFKGTEIDQSKMYRLIYCLNIRDHQGYIYFPEVLWTIMHSLIGNNDEKVHNCAPVKQIIKTLKRKYLGLGKDVTLDSLCGNKFSSTTITVTKYLMGIRILKWWQKTK